MNTTATSITTPATTAETGTQTTAPAAKSEAPAYVFNPLRFNATYHELGLKTDATGRFNGKAWVNPRIERNLTDYVRENLYPHRNPGDKVLNLEALRGRRFQATLIRPHGELEDHVIKGVLKGSDGIFTLRLGHVLAILLDGTWIRISNLMNWEENRAWLAWEVGQNLTPLSMKELLHSETFRQANIESYQKDTAREEVNSVAAAFKAAGKEEWSPTEGNTPAAEPVTATPPAGEEFRPGEVTEEEVISTTPAVKRRITPPAIKRRSAPKLADALTH